MCLHQKDEKNCDHQQQQTTTVNDRPKTTNVENSQLPTDSSQFPSMSTPTRERNSPKKLKILLCSENVPPQVNGIARRIGHYADGLRKLGCDVDLLHPESGFDKVLPHVNPWNFTARMMVIVPLHLLEIVTNSSSYDVVHVVLPLNLSGMWILAAFQVGRMISKEKSDTTLVCSWHCNMYDYIHCHSPSFLRSACMFGFFDLLCGILPCISDRILTPTRATDPKVISMWAGRSGVCNTGIQKGSFSPDQKSTKWGMAWEENKQNFLREKGCQYLLVCVGRLSPEKGTDELIKCMSLLEDCALWLVGDGPGRKALELLVEELDAPVQFLGYQKGEALHAAYAVADVFVCPSLTETFGQTVNEALASKVRVALPSVKVFLEAYSYAIPADAFWEPLDRRSMSRAIMKQLERHRNSDPVGLPDLDKLKTWDEACRDLVAEYEEASKSHQRLPLIAALFLPLWYLVTFVAAIFILYLAFVRTLFGGSFRFYVLTAKNRSTEKLRNSVKNLKEQIHNK